MSIIFGTRKLPHAVVTREELLFLATATEQYAVDGTWIVAEGRIGMGFQSYHTHERSNLESQPVVDAQGNMLSLDGRLDNHSELRNLLDIRDSDTPDSVIVLAAFRRWGEAFFSKLIGDWALALWSASEQIVYLARDHAGTRTLYFRNSAGVLQWSTHLENFFVDGSACRIDEDYAACYLGSQLIRDLTPYKGIRSVPPAHYLAMSDERVQKQSHWNWIARDKIRYRSDADYEEQFLSLFEQSVRRRSGPGAPILAQLSGGMDSTSIVCMSDQIRGASAQVSGRVDTISFYDDSEPNWNERPYFSLVESRRGKTGIHMATSFLDRTFSVPDLSQGTYLFPGTDSSALERERQFQERIGAGGYRTILSGLGGDEFLGGFPTPSPELADYLVSGNLALLLKRAFAWCVVDRTPLIQMLFSTMNFTGSLYWGPFIDKASMPPWISPHLQRLCKELAVAAAREDQRFGISPSAISNGVAWWATVETLPHLKPLFLTRYEYRYPYLDRDLVEFLFRIPREQLVRPGRRRSLMRRALRNIVPVEILERRRKAFFIRGPLVSLQRSQGAIEALFADSLAIQYGLIDGAQLRMGMDNAVSGANPKWWPGLYKAISFELWLRGGSRIRGALHQAPQMNQAMLHRMGANKLPSFSARLA